jgi:hypothetical protein
MFLELWLLRYRAKGRNKQNVEGDLQVLDLKVFHEELAADLVFFMKKIISYYDGYRNIKPTFKEKNKVYLV